MRERAIDFSCRCGRRLTAVIYARPSSMRILDHARPLYKKCCPTPGCRYDYSRLTVDEFKEHAFFGF